MFDAVLGESMLKRAQNKGLTEIRAHNLRNWTSDAHRTVDDKPFGGGAGMVMKIEPVWRALNDLNSGRQKTEDRRQKKVILLTPQGKKLDQKLVKKLAKEKHLIFICGHYEGVDERIRELADEEISIGDYILTCGELPAMVLIDSVVRLIPGVLGGGLESTEFESFENGILEYPQWTRPAEFKGKKAPQVLLSGDHERIEVWRKAEAIKRTMERRPDLLKNANRKTRRR